MPIDCEDQELLEGFLAETTELLEKLDDDLIALEKSSDDPELMNRIFRSIHTVKGASSFLGFDLLVRVTHKTEDVLNRLRKGEITLSSETMDVILEATDLVKTLVSDIKAGEIVDREIETTVNKLIPFLSDQPPVQQQTTQSATAPAPPESAAEPAVRDTPAADQAASTTDSTPEPEPPPSAAMPPAPIRPAPEASKKTAPPKTNEKGSDDLSDNTTVRVDVKRLDDLMNQVGELVLERNRMIQLNQDLQGGSSDQIMFGEEFGKLTKRMSFVTSELQMQVLKMRMIPVEKVFKKFPPYCSISGP